MLRITKFHAGTRATEAACELQALHAEFRLRTLTWDTATATSDYCRRAGNSLGAGLRQLPSA
jgi:hypothetical protein